MYLPDHPLAALIDMEKVVEKIPVYKVPHLIGNGMCLPMAASCVAITLMASKNKSQTDKRDVTKERI